MNDAQIFPDLLDLQFSLGSAVKVESKLQPAFGVTYISITGFRSLAAARLDDQLSICTLGKQCFRNFHEFIEVGRWSLQKAAELEDPLIATHMFQKLIPKQRQFPGPSSKLHELADVQGISPDACVSLRLETHRYSIDRYVVTAIRPVSDKLSLDSGAIQ